MKRYRIFRVLLGFVLFWIYIGYSLLFYPLNAKSYNVFTEKWKAQWITVPNSSFNEYGVYLFRKTFVVKECYDDFHVLVSADNRYKLFVNGCLVSMGPAKSDLSNWKYERVNIAPFLRLGENIVSAQVWNDSVYSPEYQNSYRTAFILQGETEEADVLNTDVTWRCIKDLSNTPIPINTSAANAVKLPGWYVVGPGEKVDMHKQIYGWQDIHYDDTNWSVPQIISVGIPKNIVGVDISENIWRLTPSALPQMEYKKQCFDKIRYARGIDLNKISLKGNKFVVIPSNSTIAILLDQSYLTNAYPMLHFSGGDGSTIVLTYAEALYESNGMKGNRNDIVNKLILGRKDSIISNGQDNQCFTTLSYRTYRYVEMLVNTKDEPLYIDDFFGMFTGYPFQLNAEFSSDNVLLDDILKIGWRTARLCAHETYMDCPYWEQLQYIGDTRIQALISLYNSGDDRLVKNAINLFDLSRRPEGITLSRYPSANSQIIPTFSLSYIGLLYDYMMYGSDSDFVKSKVFGVRHILEYFENYIGKDGSVENLPNWFFTDWVNGWEHGMGPIGSDGSSALIDLQLLLAYQYATEIERNLGLMEYAIMYEEKSLELLNLIKKKYWVQSRCLFSDTVDKNEFSQHTNALAILAGVCKGDEAKKVGKEILSNKFLKEASIYFKYYVYQALVKAGYGDDYLSWLDIWKKNINLGMTTWGEDSNVEFTRSDCHAWGASPNIEFFRTVLGVSSASMSFKQVRVAPHLGTLKWVKGKIPHPNGFVEVCYKVVNKSINIYIHLPDKITGEFIYGIRNIPLHSGENKFVI